MNLFRKRGLELPHSCFHTLDHRERNGSVVHYDPTRDDLSLAVQVGDSAPEGRANLNVCNVSYGHRNPTSSGSDRYRSNVIETGESPPASHDIFRSAHLQDSSANILVRRAHRIDNLFERDSKRDQLCRVHLDLILLL